MAIANPTDELDHLELARHLEAELSKANFTLLWEAFYSPESNSRRIHLHGFSSVIRRIIITPTTSSIVLGYLSDAHLASWFHALDTDANSWVEWADLEAAISLAATMRMCVPEYVKPSKLTSSSVYFPGASRVLWVPEWRRSVVCLNSANAPRICTFAAGLAGGPLEGGHTSPVFASTYVKATKVLLTFGCDRRLCVWDHRKPTPLSSIQLPSPPTAACFDIARQWYWVATTDGKLTPFDTKWEVPVSPLVTSPTSKSMSSTLTSAAKHHTDWVQDMLYLEEVNTVITASLDRTIGFWDSRGVMVSQKVGHSRGVYKLAYASNARILFSSGQGKEICAWNPFSMDDAPTHVLVGHEREIVALVPDVCNKALTSIDASARVVVWDTQRFVKVQVLDLAALMLSASPLIGAWQSPVTRELVLLSVDHAYHVRSTLESARPPRLGHRVRCLLSVDSARVIVAALTHSLLVFDLIDGSLMQLLERPFGASTSIVTLFAYDAVGVLLVQLDSGRVMTYRFTAARPLPQLQPTQLPLRAQSALSNATMAPPHELWVAVQWSAFSHRSRSVQMHRLAVVGAQGSCWTQCYSYDEAEGLQLASAPAGTFFKASLAGAGPKQTTALAKAVFGRTFAALITKHGDVMLWNHESAGTNRSTTQEQVETLVVHRVGLRVTSRVIDAMFLPNRNALLLLRPDGVSLLNVGSWTPLVDLLYDDFPDLTDAELMSKRDAAAAAHLTTCSNNSDASECAPACFELVRFHNVFGADGTTPGAKEDVWVETNYMGRIVVLNMEHMFQEFFGSQSTPIGVEEAITASSPTQKPAAISKVTLAGQLSKWFSVQEENLHVSATSSVHGGVDTRNKEPVAIKRFSDRERFLLEVALRARDTAAAASPAGAGSPTSLTSTKGADPWSTDSAQSPRAAAPAVPSLPGLGLWAVRTIAVDEDAVKRAKADITAATLERVHSSRRMANVDGGDGVDGDFQGSVVLEMSEGSLQQHMPQPSLLFSSVSSLSATALAMRAVPSKTFVRSTGSEKTLSLAQQNIAVACLVHIVAAIEQAGCATMDIRPRSICRVGDIWKLCGVDALVPAEGLHSDPLPAAYCPPELCIMMCAKVGVHPTGPSITTCLQQNAPSPMTTTACTIAGNMWTIAVAAWELYCGVRLFDATARREAPQHGGTAKSASLQFSNTFSGEGPTLAEESQLLYEFVEADNPHWLSYKRSLVPDSTAAGVLVKLCLHRNPADRASPAAVLAALKAARLELQLEGLFTRPSFFRRGVENALPRRLVTTVRCLEVSTSENAGHAVALDLPNCAVVRHACPVPSAQALACCDVDPTKSNEGVLHLYLCRTGEECGYLPPPEFGNREEGGSWHWPLSDEVSARNDAKVVAAQAQATTGTDEATQQSTSATPDDDEPARSSAAGGKAHTSFVQQLQPPHGWQQMSVSELTNTLRSTVTTDFLRNGVEAAVETFAVAAARKTPFFRGGHVTGDAMPMYAPKLQRIGAVVDQGALLQTDASGAAGKGKKKDVAPSSIGGNAGTLRKWQRYWSTIERQMKEEVGLAPSTPVVPSIMMPTASSGAGGGLGRMTTSALKKDFLQSVPTISHDQQMLPMVTEEIEAMVRNTTWLLQEVGEGDTKHKQRHQHGGIADLLQGKKSRTAQSQGVVDDALRTHSQRLSDKLRLQSAFTYTDNNLSSLSRDTRTDVQSRLSTRLSPVPQDSDDDVDELEAIEEDLRRSQQRSERRQRARDADLRRRGLAPVAPTADVDSKNESP